MPKQYTINQAGQFVLLARVPEVVPGENLVHVDLEPLQFTAQKLVVQFCQPVQIDGPEGPSRGGVQQGHHVVRRRGVPGNLEINHDAVSDAAPRLTVLGEGRVLKVERIWPNDVGTLTTTLLTVCMNRA